MERLAGYALTLFYLLIGLLGTGIVIFIHELGHYAAAKMCHVSVEILSFGFGRPLFSHMGKNTEFRISLIPFGGYCRLGGSEDLSVALANNEKKIAYAEQGSLFAIHPLKKLFIYAAGPVTNIILAYILFLIVAVIPVERVSNRAYVAPVSAYPTLFDVDMEQDGIQKGDEVISCDGTPVKDYEDLASYLSAGDGESVTLTLIRDGEEITCTVTPLRINGTWTYGITNLVEPVIGRSESPLFAPGDRITAVNGKSVEWDLDILSIEGESFTFTLLGEDGSIRAVTLDSNSFPFAFRSGLRVYRDTANSFGEAYERTSDFFLRTAKAIGKLMTLHIGEALKEISGPFSSASNMGRISTLAFRTSSSSGIRTVFYLLAIVSISICVGNLIPIPTFDGGQMLICTAEIIRRRPLRPRAYLILHITGLVLAWSIVIVMNSFSLLSSVL